MHKLINNINFIKLKKHYFYIRIKIGSFILISKYNEFLEKIDPFGIKINNINLKRLRNNRAGLLILKLIRRWNIESYKKFTNQTEMQYNLFFNELSLSMPTIKLSSYTGEIFLNSSNYRSNFLVCVNMHNLNKNLFSISSVGNGFYTKMYIRSKFFFDRFDILKLKSKSS
jgi:hypothetical protein